MDVYTQDGRPIRIETPLGKDKLLLHSFIGKEGVSCPFEFHLKLWSPDHDLPLEDLIGTSSTIAVRRADESERLINGIISEFAHTGTFVLEGGSQPVIMSSYEAKLVPWVWKLSLNRDCRIFQMKSVPEIVSQVLDEHKLGNFEMRLSANYSVREYCVQYRESDLSFISRLLEEEGIFYFFEHKNDRHTMVIVDDSTQFRPLSGYSSVDFIGVEGDFDEKVSIKSWESSKKLCTEKVELKDFNFRNPALNLAASLDNKNLGRQAELYDYPGEYETMDVGDQLVRIRFEEEKAKESLNFATTNCTGFIPGYRFELNRHPRRSLNVAYSILSVEHTASQSGNFRSGEDKLDFQYQCRFECIPQKVSFRPKRSTPVPRIQGTQTAIVVGPKDEEIHVDKHGRVKVHFHWDRVERNSKSSCWIRVSQPWAGTGFGGVTIPRVGQEVIVDFLEGDPDRPIITGRVYNGAVRPPYDLPANKAHSGLMSRSTPGGGSDNFNGIRMDDGSGAEGLEIQAEKDQRILVKNDKSENVGNNETIEIGVDRSENVGNNESLTVGNNQQISIGTDRSESVGNNESVEIGSNRNTTIGSNDVLSVRLTRTHSVGVNEAVSVGIAQEVSIGTVQIVTVGVAQINNIGMKQKTNAGTEISLNAPRIILKATEELTLKCGGGVITFDAAGNITIKGPLVKINT